MSVASFPWRIMFVMIACLCGAILYYDIFTHGSFQSEFSLNLDCRSCPITYFHSHLAK